MSTNGVDKSVVLWHLQGIQATFYEHRENDPKKRVALETQSFTVEAYLAYKQISVLTIAAPIQYLCNLSSLKLQKNRLTTLPRELWRLSNLQELNVGYNELTQIPPDIARLTNLRELYIHNNRIPELPSQIGQLQQLEMLDVTRNQLRCLPVELKKLSLSRLWIDDNPFELTNLPSHDGMGSLRSVCLQIAGTELPISELCSWLPEPIAELLILQDPSTASRCSMCGAYLYHADMKYVQIEELFGQQAPVQYQICGTQCRNRLISSLPSPQPSSP